MSRQLFLAMVGSLLSISLFSGPRMMAAVDSSRGGAVYVMSNKAKANSVLVYQRAADGKLTFVQEAPTHGLGTGVTLDPLQSQGALAMCSGGKTLLAVNPGSGELTAFEVTAN